MSNWIIYSHLHSLKLKFYSFTFTFVITRTKSSMLKRIITGDEKWVAYNNVTRKKWLSEKMKGIQSTSKADIHEIRDAMCKGKGDSFFLLSTGQEQIYRDNGYSRSLLLSQ